jgi:hypothetical protein
MQLTTLTGNNLTKEDKELELENIIAIFISRIQNAALTNNGLEIQVKN